MTGVPPLGPRDAALAVLLVAACATDLRARRIPNVLTLPAMALGAGVAPLYDAQWWQGIAGILVAFAAAFPGWRFGGAMRAGDVKLLMAAGSFVGWETALRASLFSYALALPFGLLVLAVRGRLGNLWRFWVKGERQEVTLVAFAPVIVAAVTLARLQPWPELPW
jgi:Flp pilus assembly protein protease CpaA